MNDKINHPPLIAVVGFTASGKTDLAMSLARKFGGEIIAADAVTIYKEFDIGSAKPSQNEQSEIQHHMLDFVDATTSFSAAMFKNHVDQIIENVASRGKVPILVGGSGLYIDSVLFDYDFRDNTDSEQREVLSKKTLEELMDIVKEKKLNTENIDIYNKRRLIRLIETNGQIARKKPLRSNTLVLGIDITREELRFRVSRRVGSMLQEGLEAEVLSLSEKYGWDVEPMRSIGYREWKSYFAGESTIDQVISSIETHTMQLAKKQKTWFRRNEHIHWVNNNNEAVALATTFMNKY